VCLEFSTNDFFGQALRVDYLDTYPHLDLAETDDLENVRPFITKSASWRYEDEFRLVVTQHPYTYGTIPVTVDGFVSFLPNALRSVILGPLMPPDDRDLLRKLAKGSGWSVRLKEAVTLRDRYDLEIRDI
jgi:hypothetical protein